MEWPKIKHSHWCPGIKGKSKCCCEFQLANEAIVECKEAYEKACLKPTWIKEYSDAMKKAYEGILNEETIQKSIDWNIEFIKNHVILKKEVEKLNPESGPVEDFNNKEKQWNIIGGSTYQEIRLMTEGLARNNKQHLENVIKTLCPTLELAFRRGVDEGKSIERRTKRIPTVEEIEKVIEYVNEKYGSEHIGNMMSGKQRLAEAIHAEMIKK